MSGMRKSDRLIPWYFVLFFIIIAAVDGAFVTVAIKTMPGETTAHPYEKGLAYNAVLEWAAQQKELGWHGDIDIAEGRIVIFRFIGKDGKPLSGAAVTAHMTRPVNQGHDFDLVLPEAGAGTYRADGKFPLPGLWNVNIEAEWQGHRYYLKKSLKASGAL